jgi:hypothetical protein
VSWRFNPPPSWPVPGGDWLPPAGWAPDPGWPPAPPGWEFWVYVPARPPGPTPPTRTRLPQPTRIHSPVRMRRAALTAPRPGRPGPVARAVAAVVIAVLSVLSLAVGAGLHFDLD